MDRRAGGGETWRGGNDGPRYFAAAKFLGTGKYIDRVRGGEGHLCWRRWRQMRDLGGIAAFCESPREEFIAEVAEVAEINPRKLSADDADFRRWIFADFIREYLRHLRTTCLDLLSAPSAYSAVNIRPKH
jgi:hypothetical protein